MLKTVSLAKLVTLAGIAKSVEKRIKDIKADGKIEPKEVALAVATVLGDVLDALDLVETADYIRQFVYLGYSHAQDNLEDAMEIAARVKSEAREIIEIGHEAFHAFNAKAPE